MSLFKGSTGELEQAVDEVDVNQSDEDEDLFALLSESADEDVDQDLLNEMLEDTEEYTEETNQTEENAVNEQTEAVSGDESVNKVPATNAETKRELSEEDRNAVTIITKGTTINGSIVSDCSLEVMGNINGDIECLGKLFISGKVTGNSLASDVVVNTERLEGSIVSEGNVRVDNGTVIIGDITAASAAFAGAIKGEIDVKGPVVLESTAIIKGNIKAKSIQMDNGAVMNGFCSLSYADRKIDDIFE